MITTKYLIIEIDQRYEPRFETGANLSSGPMGVEQLSTSFRTSILHRGTLDDPTEIQVKKIQAILDIVEQSNKDKKFDSELLEAKLLECEN